MYYTTNRTGENLDNLVLTPKKVGKRKLLKGSEPHITNKRSTRSLLPKPRLVGIELNPGPTNPMTALVKAVTKGVKNEVKSLVSTPKEILNVVIPRKSKQKQKIQSKNIEKNIVNKSRNGLRSKIPNPKVRVSSKDVVVHHFKDQLVTVCFRNGTTTGRGALYFSDGVNESNYGGLQLNPISVLNFPAASGITLSNIAKNYEQFFYTDYKITFIPVLSEIYSGAVSFCVKEDPFTGWPTSGIAVSNVNPSMSLAVNQTKTLDVRAVLKNAHMPWFLTELTNSYSSDIRQCAPGVICGYGEGFKNDFANSQTFAATTVIGYLSISGTIEFSGLVNPGGFTGTKEIKEREQNIIPSSIDHSPGVSPIEVVEPEKFISSNSSSTSIPPHPVLTRTPLNTANFINGHINGTSVIR